MKFLPVLFLLLFLSCSSGNEVSVSSHNFDDEVQLAQNLSFTFNNDLMPEAELGDWQATKYLEIEPTVNGWFKWVSKNELVFSPTQGFAPATQYKVRLSKNLLNKTDNKFSLSGDELTFHTPYLQLEGTESYWTKSREDGSPVAKVKVNFNYPVNASDVANKLTISNDDSKVDFKISQSGATSGIPIAIRNVKTDKPQTLDIAVEKGLSMPNSTYKTEENLTINTALPDPKIVEITDVQSGFENNEGFIKVITTQELKPENLKDYYAIEITKGGENQNDQVQITYDTLGNPIETIKKAVKTPKQTITTRAELTENGLIIKGDFNETDNYLLTLKTNMTGLLGAKLADDYTKDLYFGKMPATIAFTNKKAVYLSSKGNRNVGINIVNVPKVNIKISKIYENNLLQFMRNNRYQNYDGSSEDVEGGNVSSHVAYDYTEDSEGLLSDMIVQKTIETGNLPKSKNISLMNLPMPDQGTLRGVFLVNINSEDEYYLNATKLVSISDIGLMTKQSEDEVAVWTRSVKTAEPLGGVEVKLISSNNQMIQTFKTNSQGLVVFKGLKASGFKVAMITASESDDFNYLLLEDTEVETSRFEVDGARDNASGMEAFIYGDRNIYRPGETVYFNTVIRKQDWESAGEVPIKIRILMPNGKELKVIKAVTNSQGAVEQKILIDRAAVTGTYSIEVLGANDVLLASQNVSIEEFMPDRIKVEPKSDKEFYRNGETANLTALATNLFGPPAAGRNYEMELKLSRKLFQPKGYNGYIFDIQDNTTFEDVVRQGTTNDNGLASENYLIPANYADMGVLEGKCYMTVFDETGRPVNRLKRFDVFTQPVFYGIGLPDTYVSTNVPLGIPLVVLNKDGKPTTATARVEIVRFDYQTVIEKNSDNSLRYSSKKQTKTVYARTLNFAHGRAEISYAPNVSGEYEVRVHRESSRSWTAQSFYAYGYGNTQNSSFEVNNEGQVTMEFDKERYKVGDKAKVLFKTPFAGKLLITIERNKVLEYHELTTDKKSAEFSFTLGKEHLPNVYVSATLIRPMDGSNLPLTVAHGYAPIMVDEPDNQLPIEIMAVEKSRSKTKQTIRVKTKANTQVTIAVVDEGILQLKNFKTPDPYGFFYQKRALEVRGFDLYPFLLPEISISGHSSTGGDGYDLEKRINPLSNGRVNLVAFWSGIKETGFNGETEFEVEIPQFSGDLRIMAIAYKDEAFGSSTKNMKVADPLVLSTALPRFASPNDELLVPVSVTNTTKKTANVTATISLSGSLQAVGSSTQTFTIAPEKEGRTQFSVKASPTMGNGTVIVTVNGLGEKFTEKIELSVRPSTSLLKMATSGVVQGGQNATVSLANDYIPSTVKNKLLISKSPMVQFTKHFQDLLGYPYGCLEQTISKAFPQLYFSDFVKQLQADKRPYMKAGESDLNPNTNVQAAIRKLETLQLVNGGMSMWQAGDSENWWSSAYAAHFLIESQKAGFEINTDVLGKLMGYLNTKSNTASATETDVIWEGGSISNRQIAKREMIYSLYTLALGGNANRAMMNYYKSNMSLISTDEKYLLAATYNLIGDTRSYTAIMPKVYGEDHSQTNAGGSFSSPIRNMALSLNTLIDSDPNNIQIPTLVRQLSEAVRMKTWLSTQEQSFAFLAMGKLAKKAAQSTVTASILSDGKTLGNFSGKDLTLSKGIGSQSVINTTGRGSLYYFGETEGLSASGKFEQIDNVLRVRKTFMTRSGQVLGTAKFKQNDLIVVKITIQTTNGLPVENVVLTDMLPAGLEIENPRLTADRDLTWIKDQANPEHFDIRDDRINYFTTVNGKSQSFYYLVRAVSKGKFTMGPVSADAMYNGEYRSYWGGGVCVVE